MKKYFYFVLIVACWAHAAGAAAQIQGRQLPAPQMERGRPLMQALKDRHTTREFSAEDLSLQTLSNLLWAAFGVNRADSGKRTAPSAMNMQEIDIYVAKSDGLYLYDAKQHVLMPVLAKDIREVTGKQAFVHEAPINLILVADFSKMGSTPDSDRKFYAGLDTGYISENIYLFCASEALATVARGSFDQESLRKAMKLRDNQMVILAQTVGYPKR